MTEKPKQTQVKPISEMGFGTEPPPTVDTWQDFQELNGSSSMGYLYVAATYDMLEKLEKVVVLEDLSQMKEELTRLYSERYEFVSHAINNTI